MLHYLARQFIINIKPIFLFIANIPKVFLSNNSMYQFFSLHILKSTFLSTCQHNKYIRDIIDETTILISIRIIVHIMNLKESSICFLVFPWSISNQFILLYCLSSSHVVYVVEEIYYSDYVTGHAIPMNAMDRNIAHLNCIGFFDKYSLSSSSFIIEMISSALISRYTNLHMIYITTIVAM